MQFSVDKKETRLKGLPVSGGVAMARVFFARGGPARPVPHYSIGREEVESERQRLSRAVAAAVACYDQVIEDAAGRVGEAHSQIFAAQQMMTGDPLLFEQMADIIARDLLNAETAVQKILHAYEAVLRASDDDYIRERAGDVAEVRQRLLDVLAEEAAPDVVLIDHTFRLGEKRIIVAEELTPGLTVGLDTSHTVGFITERGGRASHSAILARALGIPAVSGIEGIQEMLGHGEEALINGDTGEVTLWPSERTLRVYPGLGLAEARAPRAVQPVPGVCVVANINLAHDVDAALAMQAEGIGLYRSEYEFLAAGRVLDEDEQYERYAHVLDAMGDRPVFIRLLDLGGDKSGPFLNLPEEDNPVLGYRGARLLERRPELLITQARALARCAIERPVNVMYPMIASYEQFLRLRELVVQYTAEFTGARLVHGVMFEVPSAVLDAGRIFRVAEFGSIGSNDLTQYLFAVDRCNEHVAADFKTDHPAFWSAVEMLARSAREAGRPLGICGEIASRPEGLPRLLRLGISQVSVSARLIPVVRGTAMQMGDLSVRNSGRGQ
jgi:phosphotransferase system enzyme I (PtsI)